VEAGDLAQLLELGLDQYFGGKPDPATEQRI
jgi:hypothetical protein